MWKSVVLFWQVEEGQSSLVCLLFLIMIICLSAHATVTFDPANVARASLGSAPSSASFSQIISCHQPGRLFSYVPRSGHSSTSDTFSSGNENASCVWQDARCPLWPTAEWAWFWSSALLCKLSCKESVAVFFTDAEGLREDELCAAVNDCDTSCHSWLWLIKILSDHQFDAHQFYSLLNFYPTWIRFTI